MLVATFFFAAALVLAVFFAPVLAVFLFAPVVLSPESLAAADFLVVVFRDDLLLALATIKGLG